MNRRAALWCLGAALRPAFARFSPFLEPPATSDTLFVKLKESVLFPLAAVRRPWEPRRFSARCPDLRPRAGEADELRLNGILLRVPAGKAVPLERRIKAFCLMCPHELCELNYVEDALAVRAEVNPGHPMLYCPCHFSAFDLPADGRRIAGPAPRGAFRFRLRLGKDRIEITEVEKEALS